MAGDVPKLSWEYHYDLFVPVTFTFSYRPAAIAKTLNKKA